MSTELNQDESSRQDSYHEIDFMELFKKVWDGRYLILGIIFFSVFVVSAYLLMASSYYRIEATIDTVLSEQLRSMRPVALESKAYQSPASPEVAPLIYDGKEFQVAPPDEKKIYEKVLLKIGSFNILKSFWESRIGKVLDLSVGAPATDETKAFKKFYESFELIVLNPKVPEFTPRKIAVEYQDPDDGVKLLNEYLSYVNLQLWADQIDIIESAYLANLKSLNAGYESRSAIEQNKLNDEIVKLKESLKIAESLNIKETPFKELENIQLKILDSRDYLLGTKTLSQQLEILLARQGKPLSPFVSDLRSMEIWKEQMTADLQRIKELKGKVKLFSVVNAAGASIEPVKPKKLIIFILSIVVSTLLGVFIVLIKSAFDSRKKV